MSRAAIARRSTASSLHSCCERQTTEAVSGGNLRVERERIGLDPQPSFLRADLELVLRAFADAGDEQLPDARRPERAHRVQPPVPEVEVADDRDGARVRRPHRERGADGAVDLAHVRAELLVQLLVPAFHREMDVDVAERRQERIRIAHACTCSRPDSRPRARSERQRRLRQQRLPQARRVLQRPPRRCRPACWTRTACASGPVRAHDDTALRLVRAEHAVRVRAELDHDVAAA